VAPAWVSPGTVSKREPIRTQSREREVLYRLLIVRGVPPSGIADQLIANIVRVEVRATTRAEVEPLLAVDRAHCAELAWISVRLQPFVTPCEAARHPHYEQSIAASSPAAARGA
jgi:hypothetical protein